MELVCAMLIPENYANISQEPKTYTIMRGLLIDRIKHACMWV